VTLPGSRTCFPEATPLEGSLSAAIGTGEALFQFGNEFL
jgi:hypothetical protein